MKSENQKLSNRKYSKTHGKARREWIFSFKCKPCADCGNEYPPYVMDFDHREDESKLFEIALGYTRSQESVLKEIAKCDVVCSNCHRVRTHNRKLKINGSVPA